MLDDMRQAQALRDMATEKIQAEFGKEKITGTKNKPMLKELRNMMIGKLRSDYSEGRSLSAVLVDTLLQIAVTPDEYTEDAAVSAARLILEILNNG